MQLCTKCCEYKDSSEFYKNKENNTYCRPCVRDRKRQYYQANIDAYKNSKLLRNFGINLSQYNQLFTEQEGCCAVCKKHQINFSRALAVDHCHTTGKIRGLLCGNCNRAIGLLQDSSTVVAQAALYLMD